MIYQKRPVKIEAQQHDGSHRSAVELSRWIGGGAGIACGDGAESPADLLWEISIPTLEGVMRARPGDFVIRGVQGEFYPCKPDIFEATYEEASV